MGRLRVLFVSEAVTLAQVVRLAVLARGLPRDRYEVHFAASHFDPMIFGAVDAGPALQRWPILSLAARTVERRVRGGRRLYGPRILRRYLAEDLRLIDAVKPDVIVGDLRLSLAVAAPLRGVPHASLINAYWSPHAVRSAWPMPDHPIVSLLGSRLAAQYFPRALPFVFDHFAAPVNRLRETHGLPRIGTLPEVLCAGDMTLHPDPEALVPTVGAPAHHRHIGPVFWSPTMSKPAWWDKLDPGRPTAYVTLGSSGRTEVVPHALTALAGLGFQTLLSTAGRPLPARLPAHTWAAPYLPGNECAERADVVISNGGSTTSYQALAAGRPVVGIASNLDQYLAMDVISRAGAGVLCRGGEASVTGIAAAVARTMDDPAIPAAALRVAQAFVAKSPEDTSADRFERSLEALLMPPPARPWHSQQATA